MAKTRIDSAFVLWKPVALRSKFLHAYVELEQFLRDIVQVDLKSSIPDVERARSTFAAARILTNALLNCHLMKIEHQMHIASMELNLQAVLNWVGKDNQGILRQPPKTQADQVLKSIEQLLKMIGKQLYDLEGQFSEALELQCSKEASSMHLATTTPAY